MLHLGGTVLCNFFVLYDFNKMSVHTLRRCLGFWIHQGKLFFCRCALQSVMDVATVVDPDQNQWARWPEDTQVDCCREVCALPAKKIRQTFQCNWVFLALQVSTQQINTEDVNTWARHTVYNHAAKKNTFNSQNMLFTIAVRKGAYLLFEKEKVNWPINASCIQFVGLLHCGWVEAVGTSAGPTHQTALPKGCVQGSLIRLHSFEYWFLASVDCIMICISTGHWLLQVRITSVYWYCALTT